MNISWKTMAVGAAVVMVAAGATFGGFRFASAQQSTPTPGAGSTARGQFAQAFLDNLAAKLNVSKDTLTSDMKAAALQTVDQEVADGTLTQAQGAKIKDAINSGKLPELRRALARGRARVALAARAEIVKSAATAVGVQPKDLVSELRSGKSIAQVASEHNVSIDTVKTQIVNDARSKLDGLVSSGKITQARADQALSTLQSRLDTVVNHVGGQRPAASATPGA